MLFRLSNAQASFHSYINKILVEKLDIFVIVYLDNIFIYSNDLGQRHMKGLWWVLDILRKNGLFAILKKCQFHKKKLQFLGYIVSSQGIQIEDEKIKAVRNWSELKSIRDIQVFICFANLYQRFIQAFSRITVLLVSMLKTTRSSNLALRKLKVDEVVKGVGKADDRNLFKSQKSKNAKPRI